MKENFLMGSGKLASFAKNLTALSWTEGDSGQKSHSNVDQGGKLILLKQKLNLWTSL